MRGNFTRNFQTSAKTLIRFIGSPLDDIAAKNGPDGFQWRSSAEAVCNAIEGADPRITVADIQGAMAHKSSKDKDDPKEVITFGLRTASGTRVGSIHLHVDGTWKFFASRAGKEGGYAASIQKANLPGYIPTEPTSEE